MRGSANAFRVKVTEVRVHTHSLPMRIPFAVAGGRFDQVEQLTIEVCVVTPSGETAIGLSADSPAPVWFDKERPMQVVAADLRASLANAAEVYRDLPFATAFDLAAQADAEQHAWGSRHACLSRQDIAKTIAAFGCVVIDRAIIDAIGKLADLPFFEVVRRNLIGVDTRLTPALRGVDLDAWLAQLAPRDRVAIRHTITGMDQLRRSGTLAPDDGLPFFLSDVIAIYGNRYFKLKMNADLHHNIALFEAVSSELSQSLGLDWAVTLDCNECFDTAADFGDMIRHLCQDARIAEFWDRVLYLEQPISRRTWKDEPLPAIAKPVIVDETEGSYEDAALAFGLGYRGVSAKSLKGFYKALLNAAQISIAYPGNFVTSEDMNHPAGLAFQQDIAIALLLGLPHAEKNGHHFIGAIDAGQAYAPSLSNTVDTYVRCGHGVRPRIENGLVRLGEMARRSGFVSAVGRAG